MMRAGGCKKTLFAIAIISFFAIIFHSTSVMAAEENADLAIIVEIINPKPSTSYGDFEIRLIDEQKKVIIPGDNPHTVLPSPSSISLGRWFLSLDVIQVNSNINSSWQACIYKNNSKIDCGPVQIPNSLISTTGQISPYYHLNLQSSAADAITEESPTNGQINVNVVIAKQKSETGLYPTLTVDLYKNKDASPIDSLDTESNPGELDETTITLATDGTFKGLEIGQNYKACLKNESEHICSTDIKLTESSSKTPATLTISVNEDQATNLVEGSGETSCAVGGVGWIVCPIANFLASIADGAFSMISGSFLEIKTQTFATSSDTFKTWSLMRNFANVMFVIVFLVVVFSQMTSVGISNYGVKKMLPRLIIAAILVNISYFICQLAIDISNILGYSINQLLGSTIPNTINLSTEQSSVGGWSAAVGGLLVGGASVVIFWGSLGLMIPLLIAAALALLVTLLILVARQAIVVLLVVLAPIAFVAYLLPNTSNIYKFWQKIFLSMLVLFPLVSFVFGGSSLAASVLSGAFISESPNLGSIIIAAITALPLFVVPIILKTSLNAVPMLGKFASDLSNKANGSVSHKAKEAYQNSDLGRGRAIRKQSREQTRQLGFARRVEKGGFSGMLAGGVAGLGITASQIAQRDAVTNMARRTAAAFDNKELSESVTSLEAELAIESTKPDFRMDTFLKTRASDTTKTASERRAAMHVTAKKGFDKIIREMQDDTASFNQADLQMAIQSNAASLISKAPDLIKPKSVAYSGISGNDLADFSLSTMDSYVKYLNNLHTSTSNLEPLPANATDDEIKARNDLLTERDNAFHSFNSAIEDITKNPTLQAKFSGDQGRALQNALAKQPLEFQQYAKDNMHGLAAIQDDGKIR